MKILIALGILLILAITYIFACIFSVSAKSQYKLEEKLRKNEKTMGVKE